MHETNVSVDITRWVATAQIILPIDNLTIICNVLVLNPRTLSI